MSEELFLNNQKLIYFVIKKMGIKYKLQECYDVGEMALIQATKTFDENKGFKFSSYATKFIQYEICKYLQYSNRKRRKNNLKDISLDTNISENTTLIDMIDSGINIENDTIEKEKIDLLNKIIAILEPKDAFMIRHYYGLGKCEIMQQKQIAEKLGVEQKFVSYRIKRAMRIIKKIMETRI